MMSNARTDQLAFARAAYAAQHPHTQPHCKTPSSEQFMQQQQQYRASLEAWYNFQEDSTPAKDVLQSICAGKKTYLKRLRGGWP